MYAVYYYIPGQSRANVIIHALCSSIDSAVKLITVDFKNFTRHIKNTFCCEKISDGNCYIMWVNKYELDTVLINNGLSSNQPNSSVDIFDLLK